MKPTKITPNNAAKSSKARVKKEDWILAALGAMQGGGVEGIKVERLAKDLDVSKSGFYYHFQDRDDLLNQVLEYWADLFTDTVITDLDLLQMPPRERLFRVAERVVLEDLTRYEASMFAWAKIDERARQAVADVTNVRLAYIRNMLRECGFKGDDLESNTLLFLGLGISLAFIFVDKAPEERLEIFKRHIQAILSTLPAKDE